MLPRRVRGPDRSKPPTRAAFNQQASGGLENRLLAQLPAATLARLEPHLQPVSLRRAEVLFRAYEPLGVVYFPHGAVVSLVSTLASGESLEVGLIGRDGLAGTAVFPGMTTMACDGIVQIPGVAQRISSEVLSRELHADGRLSSILGRFVRLQLENTMQLALCNMFHAVEQRCVRWLLTVSDLIDNGDIPLTHELLATMLGVHRPTVTLILRSLHRAGLVTESRGRVVIRDRLRLESSCCECWSVIRRERRLLGY